MQTATVTAQPPLGIATTGLSVAYGKHTAVDDVSTSFNCGTVTALVGPNGAGKSTLGYALAGWRPVQKGAITLRDEQDNTVPYDALQTQVFYTSGTGVFLPERKIADSAQLATALRPSFDHTAFADMLAHCDVPLNKRPKQLSTGKRAAVAMATALASGAAVTILDETHNGMDANTREYFLQRLISLIAEEPRTFIVSSHLIAEIDLVATDVVIMQSGTVIHHSSAEDLRNRLLTVQGRREDVVAFTSGYGVLAHQDLGTIRQATIDPGDAIDQARQAAEIAGLELGTVSLQDAVVALTNRPAQAGA